MEVNTVIAWLDIYLYLVLEFDKQRYLIFKKYTGLLDTV